MKRFLNIVQVSLVTSLLVIPVFTLFNAECLADGVRLKDKYPPSWYQILPAEKRFVLVMNDEAVLDKETGLVWQRTLNIYKTDWQGAVDVAYGMGFGGRRGWRLPTVEELASLIDTSRRNPALPLGHPFIDVQYGNSDYYWTATTRYSTPEVACIVTFDGGFCGSGNKTNTYQGHICAVRGGYGYNN